MYEFKFKISFCNYLCHVSRGMTRLIVRPVTGERATMEPSCRKRIPLRRTASVVWSPRATMRQESVGCPEMAGSSAVPERRSTAHGRGRSAAGGEDANQIEHHFASHLGEDEAFLALPFNETCPLQLIQMMGERWSGKSQRRLDLIGGNRSFRLDQVEEYPEPIQVSQGFERSDVFHACLQRDDGNAIGAA